MHRYNSPSLKRAQQTLANIHEKERVTLANRNECRDIDLSLITPTDDRLRNEESRTNDKAPTNKNRRGKNDHGSLNHPIRVTSHRN